MEQGLCERARDDVCVTRGNGLKVQAGLRMVDFHIPVGDINLLVEVGVSVASIERGGGAVASVETKIGRNMTKAFVRIAGVLFEKIFLASSMGYNE